MDFFGYFRLVVCALPKSIKLATFIIVIITIIAGAAIWLAPFFGMIVDPSDLVTMMRSPAFLAGLVGLIWLGCAQYWVWKAEHAARIKAEEALNDRDNRIRKAKAVATVVSEGNNIARIFEDRDDTALIVTQYSSWEPRVRAMLSNQFDEDYLAQFNSARGNGLVLSGHSIEGNGWYVLLQGKLKVLNGFITELRK